MKSKALLIGFGLLSSTAFAGNYNAQLDVDYFDYDNADAFALQGTYYFDSVSTANVALAEAAYVGQNNNVSLTYFDFDGDYDTIGLQAEFFGKGNKLYGNVGVTDTDNDTIISGEIGYFFSENWLVALGTTSSDGEDPITLRTKYFTSLGGDKYFNFEASTDDDESDLTVNGDYYWTSQSSIGLILTSSDAFDYGIQFQHFFSEAVAVRLGYTDGDFGDVMNLGLTARF